MGSSGSITALEERLQGPFVQQKKGPEYTGPNRSDGVGNSDGSGQDSFFQRAFFASTVYPFDDMWIVQEVLEII